MGGILTRTLLLGLVLAILLALGLGWLASEMLEGETMKFDLYVRDAIHRHATPGFTTVMVTMSVIGEAFVILPASLIIVVVFWRFGLKHRAGLFVVAMAGALIIELTLKLTFRRQRPPPLYPDYPIPHSYSFPSGHALFSVVFFGTLAALISPAVKARSKKTIIWIAAGLTAAAIGFSRIYLGVHYPTDVIAGYTAALVWVLAVAIGNYIRRHRVKTI